MNICFVNSTRKWGGVKSWTLDLAQGLNLRGHNILIVARSGSFVIACQDQNLETLDIVFGADFNPARIVYFLKLFRTKNIDLVVVNVGKDMRTAGVAARILHIPVVHRVGLSGDMENTWKVSLMHKWVRPKILVPCQEIKHGLLQKLPHLKAHEIQVIHTGKKPAVALPVTVQTPLRLVSTSQLNADKGHGDILQALAILKNQGYSFEYHVAGTGRIEEQLKAQAKNLDLTDSIFWHGFTQNVRQLLRTCDIFLLPSLSEGLPNALLEAMAEGLVCVARNVGGIKEVWPPQKTQYLLPRKACPKDFAQILQELCTMSLDQVVNLKQIFWQQGQGNSLETMVCSFEHFASTLLTNSGANKLSK